MSRADDKAAAVEWMQRTTIRIRRRAQRQRRWYSSVGRRKGPVDYPKSIDAAVRASIERALAREALKNRQNEPDGHRD